MAEKSRIEIEGSETRNDILRKNTFNSNTDVYSEEHDSAKTHDDESHKWGKGSRRISGGHTHVTPNKNASKTQIETGQFDTETGGGSYDIYGKDNVGGRLRLQAINLYNPDRQYSDESVDTSASEMSEIAWK